MQNTIYIKEQFGTGKREITAYTTLTGVLNSEKAERLYSVARRKLKDDLPFVYGKIIIRKIPINYAKRRNAGRGRRSTASDRNRGSAKSGD